MSKEGGGGSNSCQVCLFLVNQTQFFMTRGLVIINDNFAMAWLGLSFFFLNFHLSLYSF